VSFPDATVLISAFDSAADVSDSEAFVSAAVVVSEAAEEAAGVLEHEARPKQNEAAMITDISLRVKGFITKSPFSFRNKQKYINLEKRLAKFAIISKSKGKRVFALCIFISDFWAGTVNFKLPFNCLLSRID
jgi:hypothetical protein